MAAKEEKANHMVIPTQAVEAAEVATAVAAAVVGLLIMVDIIKAALAALAHQA